MYHCATQTSTGERKRSLACATTESYCSKHLYEPVPALHAQIGLATGLGSTPPKMNPWQNHQLIWITPIKDLENKLLRAGRLVLRLPANHNGDSILVVLAKCSKLAFLSFCNFSYKIFYTCIIFRCSKTICSINIYQVQGIARYSISVGLIQIRSSTSDDCYSTVRARTLNMHVSSPKKLNNRES